MIELNLLDQNVNELEFEISRLQIKSTTDGDGLLTHSELKAFMNERGDEYTDSEITEAIKMADRDGDGKINCAEYKAMMAARYDQIQ